MVKRTKAYGLNNPLQDVFPVPVKAQRAPTSNDARFYEIGQIWVDQTTSQIYGLASVSGGSATWSILGPGSSDVDTLTGDTGGAISPTGGNINILGGDGITVDGSGSTLTINRDAEGGYPITPYVVGPSGQAGYTTIQSAIDAATLAGGSNVIWVQPGTYTEDLNITSTITFMSIDGVATIIGQHTPPNTGTLTFDGFVLISATNIINSAAAGSTIFNINNSFIIVTNGYVFNVPNWTGEILMDNCGEASTNDGVINNVSGSSDVKLINVEIGAGTLNTMQLNGGGGFLRIDTCNVNCPVNMVGSGDVLFQNGVRFGENVTIGGSLTGYAIETCWRTGSSQALTFNSTGDFSVSSCEIQSTNNPAIGGTGTGTLTLTGISFPDNAEIAGTLTLSGGNTKSGSFETLDQAAGLTISGNDIDADGTDANISITVSPKGTGDFIVDVGDIQDTAGDIIATRSSAGSDVTVEATNSDNTDPSSRAGFEAAVGGSSAGDPYLNFLISGGQSYTMGIDNSTATDDFVIASSNTLGTNNAVIINGATDIVTCVRGVTSTGVTSINDSINANTTINTGTSTGNVSIGNSAAGAITLDTADGISCDAATASNFTVTGAADLTLASTAGSTNVTGGEAATDAVLISAGNAAGGITMDSGATPGVTFTNGTQSHQMLVGSGSPNGSVTASQGSMYVDVAGNTSTTILYVNTDGSTTWVGVGA